MDNSTSDINANRVFAALKRLQIIDTAPEPEFDDIAWLAATLCDAPYAAIGFLDTDRLWLKASWGVPEWVNQFTGGMLFCPKLFVHEDLNCIDDITQDTRLAAHTELLQLNIRHISSSPLKDETGTIVGYLCVFDDKVRSLSDNQKEGLVRLASQANALLRLRIEAIRNQEDEIKSAFVFMDSIFRNASECVVVTTPNDDIILWNAKATEVFGWTPEEIQGQPFHQTCVVNNSRTSGEVDVRQEMLGLRKNGSSFGISLSVSHTQIAGKSIVIHFITDISIQKQITRELDRQKEFYENILNNIPTDIAVFDAEHKYIFVNPYAIRNPELRNFIIGKDDYEYAAFRNRNPEVAHTRRQKFLEAKEAGKEIRWEDTFTDPEGKQFTHLRRMFPVHDDDGNLTMVIGFGMDITERKEMEVKQAQLLKHLSVQNTQLADFCNIVSHNLRAPLVNISMLVDFIEACEDPAEQKELITRINPVLDNLSATFNDLVESIQVKHDLDSLSEHLQLNTYLARTLESLKAEIDRSGAIINTDFAEADSVYYPVKYLDSIFQNLISNSLKYRSPVRLPEIYVKTERKGSSIILSIQDNGLGIDLIRHADQFFKIGKVFHHHPHAKGFGLFMTKTHIEAMGGQIWVESEPEKGATFFIELINQPTIRA